MIQFTKNYIHVHCNVIAKKTSIFKNMVVTLYSDDFINSKPPFLKILVNTNPHSDFGGTMICGLEVK